jgi:hypothetical protein
VFRGLGAGGWGLGAGGWGLGAGGWGLGAGQKLGFPLDSRQQGVRNGGSDPDLGLTVLRGDDTSPSPPDAVCQAIQHAKVQSG